MFSTVIETVALSEQSKIVQSERRFFGVGELTRAEIIEEVAGQLTRNQPPWESHSLAGRHHTPSSMQTVRTT